MHETTLPLTTPLLAKLTAPAIAVIEFTSVARGMRTVDAIVKKAPVTLLRSQTICPGKYMVLFAGDVAEVEESLADGMEIGGDFIADSLFIPTFATFSAIF